MNPVCNESPPPPNAMVYLVPDTLFLCSNPGGIRSPSDEAKRPREVGVGGLDLSFKREEEEEEMANSGKEEEEKLDEEVVRVGDEEGRETESDDGAPRPNGGKKIMSYITPRLDIFDFQDETAGSLLRLSG